ncbi:hypothetical protein V8E36_002033 [Tilletia maclaganii]
MNGSSFVDDPLGGGGGGGSSGSHAGRSHDAYAGKSDVSASRQGPGPSTPSASASASADTSSSMAATAAAAAEVDPLGGSALFGDADILPRFRPQPSSSVNAASTRAWQPSPSSRPPTPPSKAAAGVPQSSPLPPTPRDLHTPSQHQQRLQQDPQQHVHHRQQQHPQRQQASPLPPSKLTAEDEQVRSQPGDRPSAYQAQAPLPPKDPQAQPQQPQPPREYFVRIRVLGIELLPRAVNIHLDAATNLPHFRSSSYPRISRSYREFVLYSLALTLSLPSIIIPALPIPLPTLASAPSGERPSFEERHLKANLARWLTRLLERPQVRDHLETRAFIESDYTYQPTPPAASGSNNGSSASIAANSAARKRWHSLMHAATHISGIPERDFPEGIVQAIATGDSNGTAAVLFTSNPSAAAPQIDLGAGLGLPYGVFSTPANGPSSSSSHAAQHSSGSGGSAFSTSRLSSFLKFGQSSSTSSSSGSPNSANRLSTSRNLHDDDEDLVQARAEVTRLEMHFANAAIKADKVFGSAPASVGVAGGTGAEGVVSAATGTKDSRELAGVRNSVLQATYDLATKLHSLALDEESRPISVRGGLTRSLKSTAEMLRQSLKVEDAISNASTSALLSALCYQSLNARAAKCALLQRNALVEEYHNAQKAVALKRREVDALRAGRGTTSRMRADMILEELDEAVRLERYLGQALKQLSASLTASLLQHSRHAHTDLQGALLEHARSQLGLNRSLVGGLKALRRELDTIPSYEQVIADEKKVAEERKKAFEASHPAVKDGEAKAKPGTEDATSSTSAAAGPSLNSSTFLPGSAKGNAAALAAAGLGAQGSWHQRYAVMHTSRALEAEGAAEAERKRAILAAAQKAEERERREEEERKRRRDGQGGALPPRGWEDEDGIVPPAPAVAGHAANGQGVNGAEDSAQPTSDSQANAGSQVSNGDGHSAVAGPSGTVKDEDDDEDDDAPLGSRIRPSASGPARAPGFGEPPNPFLASNPATVDANTASGVLPPTQALEQQRQHMHDSMASSALYSAAGAETGAESSLWSGGGGGAGGLAPGPLLGTPGGFVDGPLGGGSGGNADTPGWQTRTQTDPFSTTTTAGPAAAAGGGPESNGAARFVAPEQDDWASVSQSTAAFFGADDGPMMNEAGGFADDVVVAAPSFGGTTTTASVAGLPSGYASNPFLSGGGARAGGSEAGGLGGGFGGPGPESASDRLPSGGASHGGYSTYSGLGGAAFGGNGQTGNSDMSPSRFVSTGFGAGGGGGGGRIGFGGQGLNGSDQQGFGGQGPSLGQGQARQGGGPPGQGSGQQSQGTPGGGPQSRGGLFGRSRISASDAARSLGGTF